VARWAPARADVIGEYADEALAVFPAGRILIGLDGDDAAARTGFAADLAAAVVERGVPAEAAAFRDEAAFRVDLLGPFRAGALLPGDRAVLVVEGQGLLEPGVVGIWHLTAWLDSPEAPRVARRSVPRTRAAVTFDLTDAAHPRRVFADAC